MCLPFPKLSFFLPQRCQEILFESTLTFLCYTKYLNWCSHLWCNLWRLKVNIMTLSLSCHPAFVDVGEKRDLLLKSARKLLSNAWQYDSLSYVPACKRNGSFFCCAHIVVVWCTLLHAIFPFWFFPSVYSGRQKFGRGGRFVEVLLIRIRWVLLYPNVLESKLAFTLSILKTTSQFLLCFSARLIRNLL